MVDSCWAREDDGRRTDYKWFLLSPERFTESHLPWEDEFNDQPCCAFLRRMDRKKLVAIRHRMGIPTVEYRPAYQPWSWFDD
jgi:hypothetical protein